MSLSVTSDAFLWTLRLLLVVAVVWAVLRWGRSARTTVWSVFRRLLTLAIVSLLVLLNVAAPINAEQGWYLTVGDLFGVEGPTVVAQGGGKARDAAEAKIASDPSIMGKRNRPKMALHLTPTNWGGYEDFTVPGPKSGFTSTVTVWFPPSYLEAKNANREYPVIEAFHGIKPNPYGIFSVGNMDTTIQQLSASHTMSEAIIVAPHWAPDGTDNECVNTTQKGNVETWMDEDVPAWVYSTFRARPGRDAWSAFGMSAGGWCANVSAMLHPTIFATAISMGGYWQPDFDPGFAPWTSRSKEFQHYDLVALARHSPPSVALWTYLARDDKFGYPTTAKMMKAAHSPTSLTSQVLSSGGHSTDIWVPHIPDALTWLAQTSSGFAPRS